MEFGTLLWIALAGALASPLGGALSLWRRPSTLGLSIAVGFAAGALLGAFAFEMLPKAAESASLPLAVAGFAAGFAVVYALEPPVPAVGGDRGGGGPAGDLRVVEGGGVAAVFSPS